MPLITKLLADLSMDNCSIKIKKKIYLMTMKNYLKKKNLMPDLLWTVMSWRNNWKYIQVRRNNNVKIQPILILN